MSNYSQGDFDSFNKVIHETLDLFDDLIGLENKKMGAITENDVTLLDQYMNDEQAYLLQMRGLDYKREKMQELLDATGLSFRQMIDKFETPKREILDELYMELSSKAAELKQAVAETRRVIDLHLNSINALLDKLEGVPTYDKKGAKEQKAPPVRFTPTKA